MIADRQEGLAMAVLNGLSHSVKVDEARLPKSGKTLKRVADYMHSELSGEITSADLCTVDDCGQRWLEQSFKKRFGVTPKNISSTCGWLTYAATYSAPPIRRPNLSLSLPVSMDFGIWVSWPRIIAKSMANYRQPH
jgi:hypothetical protein